MGFTDYMKHKVLDEVLGAQVWTAPVTVYVGLSTTEPNDAGGNITEPVGNAYARVAVTNNLTEWPAAAGGSKSNGNAVTYPIATGDWGTIGWFFVSDAATGGNILVGGALTTPKAIDNGKTASFDAGDMTFVMN